MSIPKIIHLIEPAHNVLSVWQNTHPDWQCIEWTLEGCYAFIKRYYPDAESTYLKYKTTAQRVHMSWYYLLHRYGGVVVEGNRIPKKKVESLFLSLYDLYLIEDWFIASAAGTEFLSYAIETLPTLESKWYERFLGEKALVRSSATVIPDSPYKRHPYRVYQNYFHPLQSPKTSLIRIVAIILLILFVFQLVRIVNRKKRSYQPGIDVTHLVNNVKPDTRIETSMVKDILPPFEILQNIEIGSLEKNLGLRVPPPIKIPRPTQQVTDPPALTDSSAVPSVEEIRNRFSMLSKLPPLDPDTPSSISSMSSDSLVITPFC